MYGDKIINPYTAYNLIGFTAGCVISILLTVLTVRTAKLPDAGWPNVAVAISSLMWNLGGFTHSIAVAAGVPANPAIIGAGLATQFTGAAIWPVPLIAIWSRYASRPHRRIAFRILRLVSLATAVSITSGLWYAAFGSPLLPFATMKHTAYLAAFNGSILAVLGSLFAMKSAESRKVWLPSLAVTGGVLITSVVILAAISFPVNARASALLDVVAQQSMLIIVLAAFLFFARFRDADRFVRYSFRVVLAAACALALVVAMGSLSAFPRSIGTSLASLLAAGFLLTFVLIDQSAAALMNRCFFRVPDHRASAYALAKKLGGLESEFEIATSLAAAMRQELELRDVQVIEIPRLPGSLWPPEILAGEILELGRKNAVGPLLSMPEIELLIPVKTGGRINSVLAVSPGGNRRGLVTEEVRYLQAAAAILGDRLDALREERAAHDRRTLETVLLQQVTEAELRALRAQINPHFLFNALNSIANLIVTDPVRAETMTLRLAKLFRHVLAGTARPMTSIRDETEFLRTYLQIEEARFGDRLHVEIEVAPELAADCIPALVLQPLVENALKHGLGPKVGPGHLWISAKVLDDRICLSVEDDGLGPGKGIGLHPDASLPKQVGGIGLANVKQRLATLYQEQASLTLQRREPVGTRAIVLLPRSNDKRRP